MWHESCYLCCLNKRVFTCFHQIISEHIRNTSEQQPVKGDLIIKVAVGSIGKDLRPLIDPRFGTDKMGKRLNDLFVRFQRKGFMPIEIPELVKDVFDIMDNREILQIAAIDQELEELGWGINIMDHTTYELITSLKEGNAS